MLVHGGLLSGGYMHPVNDSYILRINGARLSQLPEVLPPPPPPTLNNAESGDLPLSQTRSGRVFIQPINLRERLSVTWVGLRNEPAQRDGLAHADAPNARGAGYEPQERGFHAAVFVPTSALSAHQVRAHPQGFVLVFGGSSNGENLAALELFDVASRTWAPVEARGTLPTPRHSCSMTLVGDTVYLVGGADGSDVPRNGSDFADVHLLHVPTMTFVDGRLPPCPAVRSLGRSHAAVALGRKIFFFGGRRRVDRPA